MIAKNKKYKIGKHILVIGKEVKKELLMCDCLFVGEIENIIKDDDKSILIVRFPHKYLPFYLERTIIYNPENDVILI